jgi:hypothetical protein
MSMKHASEEDLTLYYYGEGRRRPAIERHLQRCDACASLYRDIAATLALIVAEDLPDRGESYGLEVWQRIRTRVDETGVDGFGRFARFTGFSGFWGFTGWFAPVARVSMAGGIAALILAAFVAGYIVHSRSQSSSSRAIAGSVSSQNLANPASPDVSRRILLTSVADHLDRSERILTEIMNDDAAGRSRDFSSEQRWAEDLLTASRLFRQDALDAGERAIATVLDDLERSLLEIVHSPSPIGAADLEQIRRRIDAAALLFKVRVLGDELRQREAPAPERPVSSTAPSKIS